MLLPINSPDSILKASEASAAIIVLRPGEISATSGARNRVSECAEELFINGGTPHGAFVNWLAHLDRARGPDRPLGGLEGQAARIPVEPAIGEDPPCLAFKV